MSDEPVFLLDRWNRIVADEAALREAKQAFLEVAGWKATNALPSTMWLWTKTFPGKEVKQWDRGSPPKLRPAPSFTVNGATLDVALQIERAWIGGYALEPLPEKIKAREAEAGAS